VEYEAIEVVALSESFEIVAGLRRMIVVELDDESAL